MLTIIFLSQRRFEYYHFDELLSEKPARLVALLSPEAYQVFPDKQKPYFVELYQVPKTTDCGALAAYTLDLKLVSNIIENEVKLAGGANNVRIICSDEGNVSLAGFLRDKFAIPGPGYEEVLLYRDKVKMKSALASKGIQVPRFAQLDRAQATHDIQTYYEELCHSLGKVFMVKPVDGVASITTTKINTLAEFKIAWKEIKASPLNFEVEEFISGTLYHCDALFQNGQCKQMFVCEYLYPNLDFLFGSLLVSIPLLETNRLSERIKVFTLSVIDCLGDFDGGRHCEVFVTEEGELVFLEIAARVPGSYVALNYEFNYGCNILDLNYRIHCGKPIDIKAPKVRQYALMGVIPLAAGRISKLIEPACNSSLEIHWQVEEGEIIRNSALSVRDSSGYFFMKNSNYAELRNDFEELRNYDRLIIT